MRSLLTQINNGIKILSLIDGEEQRFKLGTKAIHFAHNALGALITAKTLNCDIVKACESLKAWLPGAGRGSVKKINLGKIGFIELIDDGYNANPASISSALFHMASYLFQIKNNPLVVSPS